VAVAVLVLLLPGVAWLISNRGPQPPDPGKVEAHIRERATATGGAVRGFWHTRRGPSAFYRVFVEREDHLLEASTEVTNSTARVHDFVTVTLDSPQVFRRGGRSGEEVTVSVRCGDGGPIVVKAYRPAVPGEVTLPKEEEETCKRLANDLFVALREALK
jgi:hypothetical protein